MENLAFTPLRELSRRIHARELTSRELTRSLLEQIDRHNPRINAICIMDSHAARLQADTADMALARGEDSGVLHGIPFTVKDSYATKGMRTSYANPQFRKHIPNFDATMVVRLKKAGGILLGKTNLPMFAFDWQSTFWGTTNNPYNEGRGVGGSSGGSAAALASGFTPMEIGSDIGGSLRIPAHFCGVVGFRPTEGSLSDFGHITPPTSPKMLRSMITVGPMARSVDDVKMLLELLWGYDDNMWQNPPMPLKNSPEGIIFPNTASLHGLRIAYSPTIGEYNVSRDTERVFAEMLQRLRESGSVLTEIAPADLHTRRGADEALDVWGRLMAMETLTELPPFIPKLPLKAIVATYLYTQFRGGARSLMEGVFHSPRGFARVMDRRDAIIQATERFYDNYDVWITPSAAHTAYPHVRTGTPHEIDGTTVSYTDAIAPFACATVIQATPIVTVPMGMSSDGLPISVQVHGKRWQDWRLLTIAEEIEKLGQGFVPPASCL
jgi:amidase